MSTDNAGSGGVVVEPISAQGLSEKLAIRRAANKSDVVEIATLYRDLRDEIGAAGGAELNIVAATLASAIWAKR